MKLSKETLTIFKNFAGINSNLLLKRGSKLSTLTSQKTVMADTVVSEEFPSDFGIYDLNEFLGIISLFKEPELNFSDKFVIIEEGGNKIKYYAASAELLLVPTKTIDFPKVDVEFLLTSNMLQMIQKTASVLRTSDLSIIGANGKITIQVGDKKNATGNQYSTEVGDTTNNFRFNLKVENLKMLPGDYTISISSKRISRFTSVVGELVYYVAVESDSTFS